jgi:hypothetical protein
MSSTPTSLQVAIHEAGHAVAHLVLDDLPSCSGPFISSVSVIPGNGFWGAVTVESRLSRLASSRFHPNDETRQNQRLHALFDIIEALAGPIAEMYSGQAQLLPFLKERMIPKILTDHADDDSDCVNIRKTLRWLEEDNPQLLLRQLWDIAYVVVASEWIGLEKVARVLRRRQIMHGDEFEAEWRKVRQSEMVRSRREIRLGYQRVDWRAALILPHMR